MAPVVRQWSDLHLLSEAFDSATKAFLYTTFAVIDDEDVVYFGQLNVPKRELTFDQVTAALERIPDEHLFPELPPNASFTLAPLELDKASCYIKRPRLGAYEDYKEQDALEVLPLMLLEEVDALELVSRRPHPGIIRYHGCRVRRGRITGLVLDKYEHNLHQYVSEGLGTAIDTDAFMAALEAAVRHLHSSALGVAHNDLNPHNVLLNADSMPVVADFGSCRRVGEKLGTTRGTPGWIEGDVADYTTSEVRHDVFALGRIRDWLEKMIMDRRDGGEVPLPAQVIAG